MHVWREGGRPDYPVGGDAVGRGVEPTDEMQMKNVYKN